MKRHIQVLAPILFACTTFQGCNKEKERTDIPDILAKNKPVIEYLNSLESLADERAELMVALDKILAEDENTDEAKLAEHEKKMNLLVDKMERLQDDAEVLAKDMNAEEFEAFTSSYMKILLKIDEFEDADTNPGVYRRVR